MILLDRANRVCLFDCFRMLWNTFLAFLTSAMAVRIPAVFFIMFSFI